MKLAMQQSQEIARARQSIEGILGGTLKSPIESDPNSDKSRPSPIKAKKDLKAHFSEPPAPPPQAPLPEKPDVARALADPLIQPLLRRSDTARPPSASSSPTRSDHSGDILRLCEELKLAKGELSNQSERMRTLESQLAQERSARESAEERAQRLEHSDRKDSKESSPKQETAEIDGLVDRVAGPASDDTQGQLNRVMAQMDEMKQQIEQYRQRAESAETERDEACQSLAEMVAQKRKENADRKDIRSPSRSRRSPSKRAPQLDGKMSETNGHAIAPQPQSPTGLTLLEKAGLDVDQPITDEQAKMITQYLHTEVLKPSAGGGGESALVYHGRPLASAVTVVILGMALMHWMNGWPKVER